MVNFRGGCITLSAFLLGILGSLIAWTIYINASHNFGGRFPWWGYLVWLLVFLISRSLLTRIVKAFTGPQSASQSPGAYQQSGQPYYQPPPQGPGAYQQGEQPYYQPPPNGPQSPYYQPPSDDAY